MNQQIDKGGGVSSVYDQVFYDDVEGTDDPQEYDPGELLEGAEYVGPVRVGASCTVCGARPGALVEPMRPILFWGELVCGNCRLSFWELFRWKTRSLSDRWSWCGPQPAASVGVPYLGIDADGAAYCCEPET